MALDSVYFDRPAQVAENQMAQLWENTNQALSEFYSTIQGLQNVQFVDGVVAPPTAPDIAVAQPFPELPTWEDLTGMVVSDTGALPQFTGTAPEYQALETPFTHDPPEFAAGSAAFTEDAPSYGSAVEEFTGAPPEYSESAADFYAETPEYLSVAPGFTDLPPEYQEWVAAFAGQAPEYAAVAPDFAGQAPEYAAVAPDFAGQAPAFTGGELSSAFSWGLASAVDAAFVDQEAAAADLRAALAAWVRAVVTEGAGGLPADIEQMLFDRARGREASTALKAEQEAASLWAGRGFSMPPGPLVEAVSVAQQQSRLAANDLSRAVLDKAAEWALGNLRHAIQHGASLEGLLLNGAASLVAPSLSGARAPKDIEVQVYEAAVRLLGAEQQGFATEASVYGQRLNADVAILGHKFQGLATAESAYGRKLNADTAILGHKFQGFATLGSTYGSKLNADTAILGHRTQGFSVKGAVYGHQLGADTAILGHRTQGYAVKGSAYGSRLSANAAIFGHRFQGFGTLGAVYGSKISGNTAVLGHQFQGYAVRGSATSQQYGSDAAIFGHRMQGFATQGAVYGSQLSANTGILGHRMQGFATQGAVYGSQLSAAAEIVRNKLGAVTAAVGKWSAWAEANIKQAEVAIRGSEAQARVNVSANEAQIHQYGLALQRMIQQKEIVQESIKALTGALAQVIGGTLAGAHVSIGVSGQSSLHGSESMSTSFNHNYDETGV